MRTGQTIDAVWLKSQIERMTLRRLFGWRFLVEQPMDYPGRYYFDYIP